ncbi:MAG: prephenate dehydrogenase/arogenate dehydrogenase family protein, partial [Gemmatimonadota bacterium]|nr:prephenate dehydrogenase/arogenate dehydrogenase family protein [Gemmatimonadota bacterium]
MNLEELRRELAQVERQLLEAVSRRQELVRQIGEYKREHSIPTRDYSQERAVIERNRSTAIEMGLSEDLAENLIRMLIGSSLTVQERERVVAHGKGTGKTALIIGGNGRMGLWFTRFLSSQNFSVIVADPSGAPDGIAHLPDWHDADLNCDLIVVATPLTIANDILHELAALKPPGLVFDIASLKGPVSSGLRALNDAGVDVTSIHPMFGPSAELLSGKHVIFVDCGAPKATDTVRALFEPTMAIQVDMGVDDHDRAIAYVLGLSHAVNIAFFSALAKSGEDAVDLARLSSTTFDSQLKIASNVAAENPHLYYEIQALNRYGLDALTALHDVTSYLKETVESKNEDGFVEIMTEGGEYLKTLGKGY